MEERGPLGDRRLVSSLRARSQAISAALGGAACTITVVEDGAVVPVAVHHPDPGALRTLLDGCRERYPVGSGIAGTVAATGEKQVVFQVDRSAMAAAARPAFGDFLVRHPPISYAVVPIVGRRGVVGTLGVTAHEGGSPLTPNDVASLEAEAERLAVLLADVPTGTVPAVMHNDTWVAFGSGSESRRDTDLESREGQFRRLIDADVVAIVRFEGTRVVEANRAFLRIVGLTDDAASEHLTLAALTPESHLRANADLVDTLVRDGAASRVETALFRSDGTAVPVQIDAVRTHADPLRWIAYVVDLSARVRTSRRAAAMLRLAEMLTGPRTLRDVATTVCNQLDALEADGVAFVGIEDGEPRVLAARGLDALGRHAAAVEPTPAAIAALGSGSATFAPEGAPWAHLPLGGAGSDCCGVVSLAFATERDFDTETQSFYLGVSSVIGLACTRVLASEQQDRERIAGMVDALVDAVLLLRPVRRADGSIEALVIEHANPAAVDVIGPGVQRPGARLRELRTDLPDEVIEQSATALEDGQAVLTDCLWLTRPDGSRQAVSIQSVVYGDRVVMVWRDVTERERVAAELEVSRRDLEAAQRLAQLGSWRVDLATRSTKWSDEMHRILDMAPGSLPNSLDDVVDSQVHPDDRERLRAATGDLLEHGGPLLFEARIVRKDGRVREVVILAEVERDPETGAPIAVSGTTQDITDQRDAERRLHQATKLLQREHEVINALQQAILPRELPRMAGLTLAAEYLPSVTRGGVGGDWYDAFAIPDGRIMLVIGDVAGHGVSSAAAMGSLRHALRAYALEAPDPGSVLTRLNRFAEGQTQATCLLVAFEPSSGAFEWARAGHPPALSGGHGRDVRWLDTEGGPPLGAVAGSTYETSRGRLDHDEWLFLYTDGLIERRDESIDAGLERLAKTVVDIAPSDPDRLCDAVLADLLRDHELFDDVCVLAAWRTRADANHSH